MSVLNARVQFIDLLYRGAGCRRCEVCDRYTSRFMQRMVGTYVARGRPSTDQLVSAIIPLRAFNLDDYQARLRRVHKGNAVRDARKSDRAGFVCKPFVWSNFIPNIVEINTSMNVRSGGAMKPAYRRTVEEMGGAPTQWRPLEEPACPVHCTTCWGIFEPRPGYRQGELVTDEKLLAYIKLKRQGSLAIYTSILGHGDYLGQGIMYRLHFAIMERLGRTPPDQLGLDCLLYGAFESGADGLQMWKKRCLFEPALLVLADDAALPPGG